MAISGLSTYQIIRYKDLTLGGNYSYNGMATMDVIPDKMLVTSKMFTIVGEDAPTPNPTIYKYNVHIKFGGYVYVLIPNSDVSYAANNKAYFVPYTVTDSMAGSMEIDVGLTKIQEWFYWFEQAQYKYALNGDPQYAFVSTDVPYDGSSYTNVFILSKTAPTTINNLGSSTSFSGLKMSLGDGKVDYMSTFTLSSASTESQIIGLELGLNNGYDSYETTSVVYFDSSTDCWGKTSASIWQLKIKQNGTVESYTCVPTEFANYEIETSSEVSNGIKTTNITITIPEITFIKQ